MDARVLLDLVARLRLLGRVALDALLHIRQREDLIGRLGPDDVGELADHRVLILAERQLREAGPRIEDVVQEIPAGRLEDLLELRVAGGVGLVDRAHELGGDLRERLLAAVVLVHDARGRRLGRVQDEVLRLRAQAGDLALVMVEREMHARDIRQVRRDVVVADRHLPVLHVLGVGERDLVHQAEAPEQRGAHQAVEVVACDQPVGFRHGSAPPPAR